MARAIIEAFVLILLGLLLLPLVASYANTESKDKNLSGPGQLAVAALPVIYVILIIIGAFVYVKVRG